MSCEVQLGQEVVMMMNFDMDTILLDACSLCSGHLFRSVHLCPKTSLVAL